MSRKFMFDFSEKFKKLIKTGIVISHSIQLKSILYYFQHLNEGLFC